MMYNDNKYCHYTSSCIMKIFIVIIQEDYNDNKYFHYTRRCIMKIFIVIIQEDV